MTSGKLTLQVRVETELRTTQPQRNLQAYRVPIGIRVSLGRRSEGQGRESRVAATQMTSVGEGGSYGTYLGPSSCKVS